METFESGGVGGESVESAPVKYNLADPVGLAVATYQNLGYIKDVDKAYEGFGYHVEQLLLKLPESVTTKPYDIVIVPRLDYLGFEDLLQRYHVFKNPEADYTNYEHFEEVWGQYSDEELSQGQDNNTEAQAVLLETDNEYGEEGLYFVHKDINQQRQALAQAKKEHSKESDHTELRSLSIAGYIIRNVMQLERGEKFVMDSFTTTRFVELESKSVDGELHDPCASSPGSDSELMLEGQLSEESYPYELHGVRLSVGLTRSKS